MKTLVLGASEKPERYANMAVRQLHEHGHEVVAVGVREGRIGDIPILVGQPPVEAVDTVTLYVGPQRQADLTDYLLRLKPRRVIFNPGSENPGLVKQLRSSGIEPLEACTLVLLSTGQF